MERVILVRYSEIGLKGKNRPLFEKKLVDNIKYCLKKNKIECRKIENPRGRILVYTKKKADFLENVFGVASFSYSSVADLDLDKIKEVVIKKLKKIDFKTFRVSVQRANKNFNLNSVELEREIGGFICEKLDKKVDLKNYDINIGIEINKKAYLFTKKIKGCGGLPVGCEGKVVAFIEDENSLVASLLMMKRGCSLIPVSMKKTDVSVIEKFSCGRNEKLRLIKNIKEIDEIAKENNAKAVVLGQTIENFKESDIKTMVLRPLVGFNSGYIDKLKKDYTCLLPLK